MVGMKIKRCRLQLNMSQAELAKRAGLTCAAICQYEAGSREPNFSALVKLAKALHVSTDFLLGIAEEAFSNNHLLEAEIKTMIEDLPNLPEEDRKKILEYYYMLRNKYTRR